MQKLCKPTTTVSTRFTEPCYTIEQAIGSIMAGTAFASFVYGDETCGGQKEVAGASVSG
jgi:hypothetical protein